jgi:hypothetical protein
VYFQIDDQYYYYNPEVGCIQEQDTHLLSLAILRGLKSFKEDKHRPENRYFTTPDKLWEHYGLELGTLYWVYYPGILNGGLAKSYTLAYKKFLGTNYFTGIRHDYR